VSEGDRTYENSGAYSVGSLARGVEASSSEALSSRSLEDINGLLGAAHVATFSNEFAPFSNKGLCLGSRDFVLCCGRQRNVYLVNQGPGASTFMVFEAGSIGVAGCDINEVAAADFEFADDSDILGRESLRIGGD
jgi:hypothetical protein